MKRYLPLIFGVLLVALLAVAPFTTTVPSPALAAVPTSIPDTSAGPSGNTVGMREGGTFQSGVAIKPTVEAETALHLENYDSTTKALDVRDSSGDAVFVVEDTGVTAALGSSIWASTSFTWTAATGFDNGTVILVPAGEIWAIHSVLLKTTENVACTGDDETVKIGDAGDADGFLDLVHADLTTTATEGTGWAAGWSGMLAANVGVYFDEATTDWANGCFIEDNSAGTVPITITVSLSEGSGETITAGAFDVHVNYTRIE